MQRVLLSVLFIMLLIVPAHGQCEAPASIDLQRSLNGRLQVNGDPSVLDFTASDLTIELNVKFHSIPTAMGSSSQYLVEKGTCNGNGPNFAFFYAAAPGNERLHFQVSDGTAGTEVTVPVVPTLVPNVWYHLAVTFSDANDQVVFYLDGNLIGSVQTLSRSIADTSEPLTIGNGGTGCGGTLVNIDALVDDVRLWNFVRTTGSIDTQRARELAGTEAHLIGYWKLNNNLLDSTSNGSTLISLGSTAFSSDLPF